MKDEIKRKRYGEKEKANTDLTLCMLGNFSSVNFFKIIIFRKFFQEHYQECQSVWFQIRTDILFAKVYQQTTVAASKESIVNLQDFLYHYVRTSVASEAL